MGLSTQTLGILYGGLSASAVYVHKGSTDIEDYEIIMGVLSVMFWTLTIIHLCKFISFSLSSSSHGNGEGSEIFTLYSLLLQHPNCRSLSAVLVLLVMLGTSFLICVGMLSPTLSVVSVLSGASTRAHWMNEYCTIFGAITFVFLFTVPQFVTKKRKNSGFAWILGFWLLSVGSTGLYNILHWNPRVLYAVSPHYIYYFFRITGQVGLHSLLEVILCIPGAVSMFVDLGYATRFSRQLAFAVFVYICLLLAFMGEAAYLTKHLKDIDNGFYHAIPEIPFWPLIGITGLATLVTSAMTISATFSIICQCQALQLFPRVKMVERQGGIYIPEMNWVLLCSCLAVLIGFRDTNGIKNSFGIAITGAMLVTTCLIFFVIAKIHHNIIVAVVFVVTVGVIEGIYLWACLATTLEGGWFTILCSFGLVGVMGAWKYAIHCKKESEIRDPVELQTVLPWAGCVRSRGILLVYSFETGEIARIPRSFGQFIRRLPLFHEIVVFVSVQRLLASPVGFSICQIGSPEMDMYHCVIKSGCFDSIDISKFERKILETLVVFMAEKAVVAMSNGDEAETDYFIETLARVYKRVEESKEAGLLYMLEKACFVANVESSFFKKIGINKMYAALNEICRTPASAFGAPYNSLIEVGMVYEV